MTEGQESGNKILKEKVDDYKKTHRDPLPELDLALLLKSMEKVNDGSPVKVACNAVDENREWIPGTAARPVAGAQLNDEHDVVFTLRSAGEAITVGELRDQLKEIEKKLPLKNAKLVVKLGEGKNVQLTELFSHSKVNDMWAGLPLDFDLCYVQEKKKKIVMPEE